MSERREYDAVVTLRPRTRQLDRALKKAERLQKTLEKAVMLTESLTEREVELVVDVETKMVNRNRLRRIWHRLSHKD